MPNQTVKNSLKAKNIMLSQINFVLEKYLTKFSCTYLDQNSSFVLNKNFFWYKPLLLLSSTYGPFHLAKCFKQSCNCSRIMAMHHFWAKSGPFDWNNFFSKNLLMSLVSFTHAYLHAKNQSQILIY